MIKRPKLTCSAALFSFLRIFMILMMASCVRSMRSCTIDWLSSCCDRSVLSWRRPMRLIYGFDERIRSIIRYFCTGTFYLSASLYPSVLDDGKVLVYPKQCVLGKVLGRLNRRLHKQQLPLQFRKGHQRPERSTQFGICIIKGGCLYSLLTHSI